MERIDRFTLRCTAVRHTKDADKGRATQEPFGWATARGAHPRITDADPRPTRDRSGADARAGEARTTGVQTSGHNHKIKNRRKSRKIPSRS